MKTEEAAEITLKVNNMILYIDNTHELHRAALGIHFAHIPTGSIEKDIAVLMESFKKLLDSALSLYEKEFEHDEETAEWLSLTADERVAFCKEYAIRYHSQDVQKHIKSMQGEVKDHSAQLGRQSVNKKENALQVDRTVLTILSGAAVEGNIIKLNCGQVDKKTYARINQVLEALGGKWKKSVRGHVFSTDPSSALDSLLATGTVSLPKDYEFFATLGPLGRNTVLRADLRPGMKVLEPSAGEGALAELIAEVVGKKNVLCMEIDPNRVAILREKGFTVIPGDFLLQSPASLYDRVVMNPPFSRYQDVQHVTHAVKFLNYHGKLVSIMSAGIVFRNDSIIREFRDFVTARGGEIIENPEGSFKGSGTSVDTVTVCLYAERAAPKPEEWGKAVIEEDPTDVQSVPVAAQATLF